MRKYLVVHHQKDTNQPWTNSWLDDQRLEAIQTTRQVAELCREALSSGELVYVHRCATTLSPPSVCCSLRIATIDHLGSSTWLVRFKDQAPMNEAPLIQPMLGQNSYLV